jgi:hypothetical protein
MAAGCWLLAAGCWLLAAGCWLLAAGCWLLAAGCFVSFFTSFSQSHCLTPNHFQALHQKHRRKLSSADLVGNVLWRLGYADGRQFFDQMLVSHVAALQFRLEQSLNLAFPILFHGPIPFFNILIAQAHAMS